MRVLTRLIVSSALLTLALAGLATASAGASQTSPVVGHLYVNDNTTGVEHGRRVRPPLGRVAHAAAGSPFAAGGAGTGHGVASQGSLQLSADGRYLLAVDAGSNQISVLRVKPGRVAPARRRRLLGRREPGQHRRPRPRWSTSPTPAPTAAATTPASCSAPVGHLHPLAGSTVALPDGSQPGDILFNATGRSSSARASDTSLIDSFRVGVRRSPRGRRPARRSPPRASAPSAASSVPPTRASCSSPTPTTAPATAPSRPSPSRPIGIADVDRRLAVRRTARPRRAGSRSAMTAASCSRSTPPSRPSRASPSPRTAR